MTIEVGQYAEVLEQALTERDVELQETEFPEVMINEALPIENQTDIAIEYVEFGVVDVMGSVKDGLIGNKTNSLKTLDADITINKATWGIWGKAATWNSIEVQKVAKVGIDAVKAKQDALYANAMATIQYAGFLGHEEAKGQEGLLTGSQVGVSATVAKTIKAMTTQEVIDMLLNAYGAVWARSGYRVAPTAFAFDAGDYMEIMSKFVDVPILSADGLPINAIDRVLSALRKTSGNETIDVEFIKIPSRYAVGITSGNTRFAVYVKDESCVSMRVYAPEILQVRQRDLMTLESGYQAGFSGALWKQPLSATYVDYKTSA